MDNGNKLKIALVIKQVKNFVHNKPWQVLYTATGSNKDISIIIGGFLGGVVLFAGGIVILTTSVAIVVRKKGQFIRLA